MRVIFEMLALLVGLSALLFVPSEYVQETWRGQEVTCRLYQPHESANRVCYDSAGTPVYRVINGNMEVIQ
jgi:hypothetical protein